RRRAVLQLDQNRAPIVGDARLVQVALWINDDREAVGPVGEASDIDVLAGQLIAVAVAPAHRHALHTVPTGAVRPMARCNTGVEQRGVHDAEGRLLPDEPSGAR